MYGGISGHIVSRVLKLGQGQASSVYRWLAFRRIWERDGDENRFRLQWVGVECRHRDTEGLWFVRAYVDGTVLINRSEWRIFDRLTVRNLNEALGRLARRSSVRPDGVEVWRRKSLSGEMLTAAQSTFFDHLLQLRDRVKAV